MNLDLVTIFRAVGILAFLVVSVVMILTILIQRPQGGGLSGAFGAGGGGGSGQTAFGTKTGDALTIATISMFVLFIGLAIALNFTIRPPAGGTSVPTASGTTPAEVESPQTDANGDGTTTDSTPPAPAEQPLSGTPNTPASGSDPEAGEQP